MSLFLRTVREIDAEIGKIDAALKQAQKGSQRAVKQRAKTAERRKRELASRRNGMLLACSAPPEVLCEIFLVLRALEIRERRPLFLMWDDDETPPPELNPPPDVLVVTWVCQAWRDAALAYPPLWATLFTGYTPNIAEWMVQHAGGCALTFYGSDWDSDGRKDWSKTPLDVALREIGRLQELHLSLIDTWGEELVRILDGLRAAPEVPILEVLALQNTCDAEMEVSDFSGVSMPKLRALQLYPPRNWTKELFPIAPNLTTLAMNCWDSTEDARAMLEFIRDHFPCLSSLSLEYNAIEEEAESVTIYAVPFPKLKLLRIVGYSYNLVHLAAFVRVSADCHLHVRFSPMQGFPPSITGAVQQLRGLIGERTDGQHRASLPFAYFEFEDRCVHVILDRVPLSLGPLLHWTTDMENCAEDCRLTSPISAPVMLDFMHMQIDTHEPWLERYQELVPFVELRSVFLQWYKRRKANMYGQEDILPTWSTFFRHLAGVETARVNYDCGLVEALDALAPQDGGSPLLPSLRHLVLDGLPLSEDHRTNTITGQIRCSLVARRTHGVPLESISISASHDDEESLFRVATMVEELQDMSDVEFRMRLNMHEDIEM